MNVRVIPIKSWRLVQRERKAVLKRRAGVNQSFSHIVAAALWSHVSTVIVEIHRSSSGGYAGGRRSELNRGVPAIGRKKNFSEGLRRRVVGDRDVQRIAWFHV